MTCPICNLSVEEHIGCCERCGYDFERKSMSDEIFRKYCFSNSWGYGLCAALLYSILLVGILNIRGMIPYVLSLLLGELTGAGIRYLVVQSKLQKIRYSSDSDSSQLYHAKSYRPDTPTPAKHPSSLPSNFAALKSEPRLALKNKIPPYPGYYHILGVPPSATASELQKAYQDKHKQAVSAASTQTPTDYNLLDDAYLVLSDSVNRYNYDMGFLK